MKSFFQFILDSVLVEKAPAPSTSASSLEAANKTNTAFGDAYETATVLHLHNNTAAKSNKDKDYQAKIKQVKQKHELAMSKLPPKKQEEATSFGAKSSHAYLGTLSQQGIEPEHIHEVHHTSQGIGMHIGRVVNRASNPHDLLIRGSKNGKPFVHGASLKAKSGTASNNSVAAFEKASNAGDSELGVKTNISKHWEEGKKKAGLVGKTAKAIKELRHNPEIKEANRKTQNAAAGTHAEDFNNSSHEAKQKHLLHFLKGNPLVPYHYVVGNKGTSVPIKLHPSVVAINNSNSLHATTKNNVVHFHNEKGEHIASAEHRTTHGPFVSPQVNFKFGTMKAKKQVQEDIEMRHIFFLLNESAANEEKLKHLEHAEDHPINAGVEGYKHAVNTLNAVHKTLTGQKGGADLMTKYDGSPSIVFGHHPQTGKFFVASKSAFNKDPKINYTDEDIEQNHGHAPGLVSKLKTALAHLPKITPQKGVFQGDVMHTSEDVEDKGGKVHFKPNLIKYSTPSNSAEGKAAKNSKIGVYVHTGYHGNDIESMKADYTPDLSGFAHHSDVHLMKHGYDTKHANYDADAQKQFKRHMEDAADVGKSLTSKHYAAIEPHTEHVKTYINKTVREGTTPSAEGLYDHVKNQHEKGIEKVKTQKAKDQKTVAMNNDLAHIRANHETINNVLAMHHHLQKAKDVLVNAMSHKQEFEHHIGDTKTKPEGFVAVVNNRPTKLVDRAEFSRQNFLARQ